PRDLFLHVKKEKFFETQQILTKKLGTKAKIVKTTNAINNGLFGIGNVGKTFSERVGDLLVLPTGNETVWFEHFKNVKFDSLGHHGGLNRNEMIVPFMISKLNDLK
ncbi:hypothetical protein KJN74_03950, partial [Candidatus Bathyarchaeota archaeon]|nr:hypothetical protein [Candidatus Bathyarchaeota archaeon]